tara:strand:+ start:4386 stop:5471 length:1086 start_codon:yes stop_codon:yes gene_type:complete
MDNKEQIKIDDITFDDVIGGSGVEMVDEAPVSEDKEAADSELDEEIEDTVLSQGDPGDEQVEKEVKEDVIEDDEEDDEEVDDTVVSEVLSKLGLELDTDGYDDTTDGLIKMTKDVGAKLAETKLDELFEAFPLVKNHLEYVMNGGESQQFMTAHDPNTDFDGLQIKEDNVRLQKSVLSDYFKQKGHDTEFINEMLEDYEDSGKLFPKAEQAKTALAKVQKQERIQLVEQQKESTAAEQKKQQEFWGGVYDTIEQSKEFAGIQIPDKEKKKFFNYVSKPINDKGFTQRDMDHSEAEMDTKLAIDYLMYKGFKLDELINKKARTKNVTSLRNKISKNQESIKSAKKRSKRSKEFDVDNLDFTL